MKHWHKHELYTHLRKTNKKTSQIITSQHTYSSSGSQVSRAQYPQQLRAQSGTHPGQDAHPHSLRLGQFRRTSYPAGHIFGMWEETKHLDKTQADMGRICILHTDSGPGWDQYSFSHQCQYWSKAIWGPAVHQKVKILGPFLGIAYHNTENSRGS